MLNGKIELAGKAPAAAFDAYVNASALDPGNVEALEGIALTGLQSGHQREAEDAAKTLLASHPSNPVGIFTQGLLALGRERFDDAVAAADKVLAARPGDEGALALKVRALFLAGELDKAMATLGEARPLERPSPGLPLIALEVARARHDPAAMLQAFGALRRLRAMTPAMALDEANVRFKTGDRTGGDRIVVAQLAAPATTPDQVRDLIGLWREFGPPPPGTIRLTAASSPLAREESARFLAEQARAREAIDLLAVAPGPNADGIKALALLNHGQEPAATELAKRVMASDPAQCEARLVMARLALRARNFDGAVNDATQVATECPGLIDATLTLALAYGAQQQDNQTDRAFGDAITRNRDNPRIFAAYANWLRSHNQPDKATNIVRRLVRAAPSRAGSWRLLLATCGDDACRNEAKAGLAAATQTYRIDPRLGELPVKGLYAPLPPVKQAPAP